MMKMAAGTSFSSGTVHFVVNHWQLALSPKECVHSKGSYGSCM